MLRDRVLTGAELYFSGKVEKLLMSGDNRFAEYNEPEAMRQFALSLGVPDEAIVLDYAGRRTYDTCYRARAIFGVDSALLVTQGFHLPRALFLCNMLGMDTLGVEAIHCYWNGSPFMWDVREQFATVAAFLDLYVSSPSACPGRPRTDVCGLNSPFSQKFQPKSDKISPTFRGQGIPPYSLQRDSGLWISRDYLWISGLRCGEVPVRLKMTCQTAPPYMGSGFDLLQDVDWMRKWLFLWITCG